MIRNEAEYQQAIGRLAAERQRLADHALHVAGLGLDADGCKRVLDPLRSFQDELAEEIAAYERLKRGDLGELLNLHGLGRTLVALRIARGLSQRELAARLGTHESQVSRDERNEYHGISVDRASRVLEAIDVKMHSRFEASPPSPATTTVRP